LGLISEKESKAKTPLQKQIDKSVEGKPTELVAEYNKLKTFYEQNKGYNLGYKEGGRDAKLKQKEIADTFKQFVKDNKELIRGISPTKYDTILKRAAALTPSSKEFTGKVDRLIQYMEDVFVKSEQSRQIKQAETNRKAANKILKSKKVPFSYRTMEAKRAINEINIADLTPEQVVQYNNAVKEVITLRGRQTKESVDKLINELNSIDYTPKEKKILTRPEAEQYIDSLYEVEVQSLQDFKNFSSSIRKAARIVENLYTEGKITEAEKDALITKITEGYDGYGLTEMAKEQGEFFKRQIIPSFD
jgi:hypothetical protein